MSFATARVAPEKAVFRPALPLAPMPGMTEMLMTPDQVRTIERLREAAQMHGEVASLLEVLARSIFISDGERSIVADSEDLEYLRTAIVANAFVEYDGEESSK